MGDFKLSASLSGHEDDIKAVVFPNPSLVVSASRDATVRIWKLVSSNPPTFDATLSSQGQGFINSLSYAKPSEKFPEGLIVSGGKDAIIDVRQPGKLPEDNADSLLLGHQGNVCALNVSEDGSMIVSGSWDHDGRVWEVGKHESSAVLSGHGASVWAVLAYDKQTVITGCADQTIRIFTSTGKLRKEFRGSADVIRALCKVPKGHPSGADFASAGNDGIIHFWTLEGKELGQLRGHENFIYSLVVLPSGELVSSSEDRTVRVWKGDQCVQTITHPAISVWSVAVCGETGDIVTGASDRIVRVFTRETERQADGEAIKAFEDSVKGSSIPQQQMGDINKEKLPGPDFLQQKSGTKEGQVQMIKEHNGNVTAYQWSMGGNEWVQVGTVVDSAGSSGVKTEFQGQDYDYVFDVDIEDGKPPLKLPYNLSQNPYEVAQKFIGDNELPISYLDQVANFIVSNTQGASLGQQSQAQAPPGSDPWGTESRYRPGDAGAPSAPPAQAKPPKVLPQTQYLVITQGTNLQTVQKKLRELNQQLLDNGRKDVSLNPDDLSTLSNVIEKLAKSSFALNTSDPSLGPGVEIALRICTGWPPEYRIPGLDLLRLLVAASDASATTSSSGNETLIDTLAASGAFETSSSINNTMLAIRAIANLFNSEAGRLITDGEFDKIHKLVSPFLPTSPNTGGTNRNLTIAITTLFINFAVLFTTTSAATNQDRALTLLDDLVGTIKKVNDSEALYRALVAAGTLLAMGEDLRLAARDVLDLRGALKKAESVGKEPRIKRVIEEVRDELA